MTDLLPCPFCGGEAETWDGAGPWHAICKKCGAIGSPCLSEAEAIKAWNARADYRGYEKAAIEAWENIKAWNARAERTCENVTDNKEANQFECSKCHCIVKDSEDYYVNVYERGKFSKGNTHGWNYCPNCGRKVER